LFGEDVRTEAAGAGAGAGASTMANGSRSEQWHRTIRKAITRQHIIANGGHGTPDETRLVHSHCQRRATGARKEPALLYS
jgi:hypothetical protein